MSSSQNFIVNIKDVASWTSESLTAISSDFVVSVPKLQRGLVWRPSQIELFWDSLLRGFPVGSLVVVKKVNEQEKSSSKAGGRASTHHLIDGQQRCNAVGLAFQEPNEESREIIWIDLLPDFAKNSTRSFLIKVTNRSHPWGFSSNDSCDKLSFSQIRTALEESGNLTPRESDYRKPLPSRLYPFATNLPIPLYFLLCSYHANAETFWRNVSERIQKIAFAGWANERLIGFLESAEISVISVRERLHATVSRLLDRELIALSADELVLAENRLEDSEPATNSVVTNIEHLFQRLNNQGTPLDSEELAYSVLKAYLPELAEPIDTLPIRPMASSRLASLGMRLALSAGLPGHLQNTLSISTIRKIVAGQSDEDSNKKEKIVSFFQSRLLTTVQLVEDWLVYDQEKNRSGMCKYQRTSICYRSPEVYYLLMCWANEVLQSGINAISLTREVQAVALVLHIFGGDKQRDIVEKLLIETSGRLARRSITKTFKKILGTVETTLFLYSPEKLNDCLRIPRQDEALEKWNLWASIVCDNNEDLVPIGNRGQTIWPFVEICRNSRELLTYAQRHYLSSRFPDYDPSDRVNFEDQNRPWDFDHILASKYTYYQQGPYRSVAGTWVNCIGNLRAWPAEDNRSDQAETANSKIKESELLNSFLVDLAEREAFSGEHSVRHKPEVTRKFIGASRARLVRIYREFYEVLGVGDLVSES